MHDLLPNIFAFGEIESELSRKKSLDAEAFSRVPPEVMRFNDSFVGLHGEGVLLTYINAICFLPYRTIIFLEGYVDFLFTCDDDQDFELDGYRQDHADLTILANVPKFSIVGRSASFERCLSIKLKPQVLTENYGLKVDKMPFDIRQALLGVAPQPVKLHLSLPPRGQAVLQTIFACRMAPPLFRRYVHAKAEELLCESIDILNTAYSSDEDVFGLSRLSLEKRKIEVVAQIYQQNMAGSPSISAMSKKLKINRNKLISGFRDMYGCGPGEYNRRKTMEWACSQLVDGSHSVHSIARAAGYSSLSSFSRSFAKHMGMSPSLWKKKSAG